MIEYPAFRQQEVLAETEARSLLRWALEQLAKEIDDNIGSTLEERYEGLEPDEQVKLKRAIEISGYRSK